jgi:hypothetical protein
MSIKLNNEQLRLRPSSIDNFSQCSWQWAKIFLEGHRSASGGRAAIGTSIHRAAEVMWKEAIASGKKDPNVSMMTDAAVQDLQGQVKDYEIKFDEGENVNTATVEIVRGTQAFIDDIVPFSPIPTGVEEFYTMAIDHPIVTELGGTVDYIGHGVIADLKTSKRKPTTSNYVTQQSIYKMLAEHNGVKVDTNLIQGVSLKKSGAEGHILTMDTNVRQTKELVNNLLDTLEVFATDTVDPKVLFRANTSYYLCSPKYCGFYNTPDCPTTYEGEQTPKSKIKL